MNIRVSTQLQSYNQTEYLRRQSVAVADVQDQLSSSLKIRRASDDPAAYARLAQLKQDGGRYDVYSQNISDATSTLNSSVSTILDVNDILTSAQNIAREGANGTNDAESYAALAEQVTSLLTKTLNIANSQVDGHYIYSGDATTTQPFTLTNIAGVDTVVYNGSAARAKIDIGPGQQVDTRYDGSSVFQQAGGDIFQALIGLRDDLAAAVTNSSNSAVTIGNRLSVLESGRTAISNINAEQSSELERLSALTFRVDDLKLDNTSRTGETEGTDYASAVLKYQQQLNAFQSTLAVSARLFQTSLLDFIK